jgi:hypothetical protein
MDRAEGALRVAELALAEVRQVAKALAELMASPPAARDGVDGEKGERGEPGERGPEGPKGADAPLPKWCRTFSADQTYSAMSIVAHNGASWIALRDNPGPLPGDGWGLLAQQGRRGERGDPGKQGEPGRKGDPGAYIVGWVREGFNAIPILSDGASGAPLDLRGMFEEYHADARKGT